MKEGEDYRSVLYTRPDPDHLPGCVVFITPHFLRSVICWALEQRTAVTGSGLTTKTEAEQLAKAGPSGPFETDDGRHLIARYVAEKYDPLRDLLA